MGLSHIYHVQKVNVRAEKAALSSTINNRELTAQTGDTLKTEGVTRRAG